MSLHAKYWPKKFTTLTVLALGLLLLTSQVLVCMAQETETEMDLEKGLVAYWKFDEGEGDIAFDSSKNRNDGALMCAGTSCSPPNWVKGKIGLALELDGLDDYVDCGNDASLRITGSYVTLAVWIFPKGTNQLGKPDYGRSRIITKHAKYSLQFVHDGTMTGQIFTADGPDFNTDKFTSDTAPLDTWTHVVLVYDEGVVSFYVDGKLDFTEPFGGTTIEDIAYNVEIGGLGRKMPIQFFSGLIDEVRIYNRALREEEIIQLYGEAQE